MCGILQQSAQVVCVGWWLTVQQQSDIELGICESPEAADVSADRLLWTQSDLGRHVKPASNKPELSQKSNADFAMGETDWCDLLPVMSFTCDTEWLHAIFSESASDLVIHLVTFYVNIDYLTYVMFTGSISTLQL